MRTTHPLGFGWHSIDYHNGKLLLPKTLVKQLAEKAELDNEQDFYQAEIDETIKQLLMYGNLSLPQLHVTASSLLPGKRSSNPSPRL